MNLSDQLYEIVTDIINKEIQSNTEKKYSDCINTLERIIEDLKEKQQQNKPKKRKCDHIYIPDRTRFDPCRTYFQCEKCFEEF